MKNKLIAVFILTIFGCILLSRDKTEFKISDAEKSTILHNNEISVCQKEIEKAAETIKMEGGFFRQNPDLEITADNNPATDKIFLSGVELNLSLPIEINAQNRLRLQKAEYKLKIANLNLQKTKTEIICSLKKKFAEIYFIDRKISSLQELLQSQNELVNWIKSAAAAGQISPLDLNISLLETAADKGNLISLQTSKTAKIKELEKIMNSSVPQNAEFVFPLSDSLNFPHLQELISKAEEYNPQIKISNLQTEIVSLDLKLLRKNNSLSEISPAIKLSEVDKNFSLGLGISFSLPFFNHFEPKKKILENEMEIAKIREKQSREEISKALDKNVAVLQSIRERFDLFDSEILPLMRKNLRISQKMYERGAVDISVLTKYWEKLNAAEQNYNDLFLEYYQTIFEIERLTGNPQK